MRCFGASVGGASARKPPELAGICRNREISDGKSMPESIALLPAMPRIGLAAVVFGVRRAALGIFEDQDAVGRRLGWVPRLVEPVQIRVVIGKLLGICFWGRPLEQSLGRTGGRGKGGCFT